MRSQTRRVSAEFFGDDGMVWYGMSFHDGSKRGVRGRSSFFAPCICAYACIAPAFLSPLFFVFVPFSESDSDSAIRISDGVWFQICMFC